MQQGRAVVRDATPDAATGAASRMRVSVPWAEVAAGILAFSLVALLAANGGGYWPTAWSWTAFLLSWVSIVVVLLFAPVSLSRTEQALLVASFALVGWIAVAAMWSESVPRTMLEVQRVAAYVGVVVACMVVVRARSYGSLLVGAWAGVVVASTYSLATRLFPDRYGQFDPIAGYRLSAPIGYWNALGILAVFGIILALGLAARARAVTGALAAASLLVLVPTLYFTFSRGAWVALGVGLAVAVALDPRRFQLLIVGAVLAACPAIAVGTAYGSAALTRPTTSLASAVREGHRLALLLAVLAIVQVAVLLALRALERRIEVPARVRKAAAAAAAVVVVVALAVGVARVGGPEEIGPRIREGFLVRTPPSGLNERLFSLSGNGRADLWSVAWRRFERSPLTGAGPGTYEISWMRERLYGLKVRDAHNLYVEAMAELGLVGTALLVMVLVLPLAALLRGRRRGLVPVAAGAYAAFLVHAGVDWDWEVPAVTATALVCGMAVLGASRPAEGRPVHRGVWGATAAAMLVMAVFSFAGIVGNSALAAADDAARAGTPARAERDAGRAETWQPWSSEALRVAGEAQLALGRRTEARSTFSRAIARDPLNWELWFDLAVASDGRARTRAARRAERLNPRSPQIAAARVELGLEPAR